MKVIVLGAYPDSIVGFRGKLIEKFVNDGHQVTVMTAQGSSEVIAEVEGLGAKFEAFPIQRNGMNPLADMETMLALTDAFKRIKPDKILAYTIKPIIWGGIAANRAGISEFYSMVTGLGYAFEAPSLKRKLVRNLVTNLYKYSLRFSKKVIFQNQDNLNTFVDFGIVEREKCHRVFGSGVDLSHYQKSPLPESQPHFLLIARILGDKGVREYYKAAKQVKEKHPDTVFSLVGPLDPSPDGIDQTEIDSWRDVIDYHGSTNNVLPYIENCHIYVLPSYHEGIPRTVLEAMAVGRPIITTDAVGCRDTIKSGYNGLEVPVKNAEALASAMLTLLDQPECWHDMAKNSRSFVADVFDVNKVNAHISRIFI